MPASVINATVNGLNATGGNTAGLELQVSGNTAVTIDSSGNWLLTNPLPVSSGGTGSNTGTFSGANVTSINASNISSGTLAVSRGGTGLGTVGTAGNVLTSNGTTWASTAPAAPSAPSTADVLNATAGASQGAVGTYVLGYNTTATTVSPGGTLAGSSIQNAGLGESGGSAVIVRTGTLSGTWRCMGYTQPSNSGLVTVWLRTV